MEAPVIQVGIFTKKAVEFCFRETYVHVETGDFLTGEQRALLVGDKIIFNGKFYDELFFTTNCFSRHRRRKAHSTSSK